MKDFPFDPYDFFGYLATGLLCMLALQHAIGVPEIAGRDLRPLDIALTALGAYVVGHMLATPAKAVLETVVVGMLLGPPSVNLMRARKPWRGFFFPGYFTALPASVRSRIVSKAAGEGLSAAHGEELFLHIRFKDYVRNDVALMSRLSTFLNMYGFSRNLSFASLVFGASMLVAHPIDFSTQNTRYGALAIAGGIALFYRYIKFFRQYTYELFNSYAGRA